MEERPSAPSNFVLNVLPFVAAAGAFLFFLISLNRWVSLASLPLVSKVAGWDWWTIQLHAPLFYLVALPARILPSSWQPLALNLISAGAGAAALGLLARSVALLPHDRTRDQRQRQTSEDALLSIRAAWVPPLLAVLVAGWQLSFWEHATSATGEMLSLLMLAWAVRSLLEYRLDGRGSRLAQAALAMGLGAANSWVMIWLLPAFAVSAVWIVGWEILAWRNWGRLAAWLLVGLSLCLLLPAIESLGPKTSQGFGELLRTELGAQKALVLGFPRWRLLLCALTSLFPLALLSIRWKLSTGETSLIGGTLTGMMFQVMQLVFLAACVGVMFDPPHWSPRHLGGGHALLPFYYLSALCVGYVSGYVLLVFGTDPPRAWYRAKLATRQARRALAAVIWVLLVAAPIALLYRNAGPIGRTNSGILRHWASELASSLPEKRAIVLSDEPTHLLLAEAALADRGRAREHLMVDTRSLSYQAYHRILMRESPQEWPDFLTGHVFRDPLDPLLLVYLITSLTRTNEVYYLQGNYNYFGEGLQSLPHRAVYQERPYDSLALDRPALDEPRVRTNQEYWADAARRWREVLAGRSGGKEDQDPRTELGLVRASLSRAANTWGVRLQQSDRLEPAAEMFDLAMELHPSNLVARVNREVNRRLQARQPIPETPDPDLSRSIRDSYRRIEDIVRHFGPFDEPAFLRETGQMLALSTPALVRQAAYHLERARQLQPGDVESGLLLADMYLKWRLPERLLALADQLRAPASAPLTTNQSLRLLRLEAWADVYQTNLVRGEQRLLEARKAHPGDSGLLHTLSQVYLQTARFTNALECLDQMLRLEPNNPFALANQGAVLIQLRKFEEALNPLNQLLARQPGHTVALLNRAISLTRLGRYEQAEYDYQTVLDIRPGLHRAYFGLAQIAMERKQSPRAIELFETYLRVAPRDPNGEYEEAAEAQYVRERLKELRGEAPESGAAPPPSSP